MRVIGALACVCVLVSCSAGTPTASAGAPTAVSASTTVSATVPPTSTIAVVTSSPTPPSPPTAPPVILAEAAAWSRVKSTAQTAFAIPTWLPPSIDRSAVEVRDVSQAPFPPARYTVIYRSAQGGAIVFALGPADAIPDSSMGAVVRGQDATLSFPSTVWSEPTKPATRRVRWTEGGLIFSITSDVFSGDDLLRIAWNLDPTTAPPPKNPFSRARDACGATAPDATVRTLVSLIGRQLTDAVADCFSAEYLGRSGMGVPQMWATNLPTATFDTTIARQPIGGRPVVGATWTFASDPGGAWNQKQTMFFTLGLEGDRFRIFEVGTAGGGPAP